MSGDGSWKLCDFGSCSTNHKRFESEREMGEEEDNIRKHTTPAYRAPEVNKPLAIWCCLVSGVHSSARSRERKLECLRESKLACLRQSMPRSRRLSLPNAIFGLTQMWDLYRRELISEKVDIWVRPQSFLISGHDTTPYPDERFLSWASSIIGTMWLFYHSVRSITVHNAAVSRKRVMQRSFQYPTLPACMTQQSVLLQALGCLLYRIAFFKSAFDGESKLQILNGNYRIPDSPKYSPGLTSLIKDMLSAEPAKRPDVGRVRCLRRTASHNQGPRCISSAQ